MDNHTWFGLRMRLSFSCAADVVGGSGNQGSGMSKESRDADTHEAF